MIKINRNIEAPSILEEEKQKKSGTYNKPEVLEALKIVFHNKCYVCENKKVTSYNIEHLKPHREKDINLKFNWDNLFLVCAHCNNIKSDKYEDIIDCTKVDADELISFRKKGHFSWDEDIEIIAIDESYEVKCTVKLLNDVYNGTTKMKKLESSNIKKELRIEIIEFIDAINEYTEAVGEDKEDAKMLIRRHLRASSPFAAFKRWIVRDNLTNLSELINEISTT